MNVLDGSGETETLEQARESAMPHFRVVKVGARRRGLRLERIYWDILERMADEEGLRLAGLLSHHAGADAATGNFSSYLRVIGARWLSGKLAAHDAVTSLKNLEALVKASSAPTFALTENKRILFFNQEFIRLIQTRFPQSASRVAAASLRLSLDVQIDELIRTLRQRDNEPLTTGFVLGFDERRLRGRLNVVLAPVTKNPVILGYLLRD